MVLLVDHKISLLSHYQHLEKEKRERQNTEKDREMGKEIEKEKPKEVVMEGRREGEEKEGR